MSRLIRRRWTSDLAAPSRRDRQPCEYEAYVPDLLVGRRISLDGEVAADVADAEAAITRLNLEATALVDTEALALLLLRAESVASSRIEGLEVGPQRLLRAEAARELGEAPSDITAIEVLRNIDAMASAVQSLGAGDPITVERILDFHRRLLAGTRLDEHAGRTRTKQNWIGGSDYNPCSAEYVPPPPEFVDDLLADLCAFCNDDSLPAVVQAALAHAQFETIHPFADGNGRTGRASIHFVLRRRGLAQRILPPCLSSWRHGRGTTSRARRTRDTVVPRPRRRRATGSTFGWGGSPALVGGQSMTRCGSKRVHRRSRRSGATSLERFAPNPRQTSCSRALIGAPVLTVNSAAALIGRSFPQTNAAIQRLVDAGVLAQVNVGRRNRAFEAGDAIRAFMDLERQLASPLGDTVVSPPSRHVPRRR